MEFLFFLTHRHLLNLLCMTVWDDLLHVFPSTRHRRVSISLSSFCLFVFFFPLLSEFRLAAALPPPFISSLFFNICGPKSSIKIQESPRGISSKVVCIGRI